MPALRRRELIPLLAAAGLAACAGPARESAETDPGQTLWPLPPEQPRFAYETTLRSAADVLTDDDRTRLQRSLAGESAPRDRVLDKPAAVAAREGRIYVTDTVRRHVLVFDVPRRKLFQLGLRSPGTLAKPIALALDAKRRLYVADASLRRVMVYDNLGLFQREIGSPGELQRPTGVAVSADGERVHVIDRADNDSDAHRIVVYDAQGRRQGEIGTRGSAPGQFNVPVQGVVGPDGQLHVLDAGNFRVQSFDADGRFVRAFGSVGSGLGSFARPRGIACDAERRLYVSDASFGNVQVFDAEGRLLLAIGRSGRLDRPGRYGLVTGVTVDETGRLYVVDQLFGKVEVLRRLSEAEGIDLAARGLTSPLRP